MSKYWTQLVTQLDPYVPGEQPQDQQYTKLNTNENPYPPSPRVIDAINDYDKQNLKLYPDPESSELKKTLAAYFSLKTNNVFLGNGSDEVLAHSFQAFFKQSEPLLFPDISYSFYTAYCGLYQIDFKQIPLDQNFNIQPIDYEVKHGGIILPNPNAPTGTALSLNHIRDIVTNSSSVVIIDEAYIDFGGESATNLIKDFDNLLVIQTFSKARSMAGLRLGYALGHHDLIDALNRIKNSFNSYPIDSLAQTAAIASINDEDYFQHNRQLIVQTRESLTDELTDLGFEVLPSTANFVFVRHKSTAAQELYQQLKQQGILVRYFDKPRINNYLRITIGTKSECQHLVKVLADIL